MEPTTLLPYAVDLLSQGANQQGQQQLNMQNEKFSMMQQQMAYAQNLDMWNRTNAYNTPQQQMQRLKDAGLNPNLIYGNVNNAPASNSVKVEPIEGKRQRVQWDGHSGILASQAVRMNEAQIKQMELQNAKIEAETNLTKTNDINAEYKQIADRLGLYKNYGYNDWGTENPIHEGSAADYDLKIKNELYLSIKEKVQQLILSNKWDELKNIYMMSTGTNIDRDSSLERKGSTIITRAMQELGYDPDEIFDVSKGATKP